MAVIDTSLAAIKAEMIRRHPEILFWQSNVAIGNSANGAFARMHDYGHLTLGSRARVASSILEDYHGLTVEIAKWEKE